MHHQIKIFIRELPIEVNVDLKECIFYTVQKKHQFWILIRSALSRYTIEDCILDQTEEYL